MNETMSTIPEWMQDRLVDRGVEDGIEWVTVRAGGSMTHVNGYVRVPEGNPWHGLDYNRIYSVSVHGGLTYSDDEWIGFDTAHSGDNWPDTRYTSDERYAINWTLERVADEARGLARQVAAAPETERAYEFPTAILDARDAATAAWDEKKGYHDQDDFNAGFEAGYKAALGITE